MQEGNSLTLCADPWLGVHQLDPGIAASFERLIQVVHRETDVVDPGAAPGDEFSDWGGFIRGLEQLYERAGRIESANARAIGIRKLDFGEPQDLLE